MYLLDLILDPRQSVKIPLNEVCGLILEREKKLGRSIYLPAPAADMLQPPAAAGFSRPSRIESHVSYPPRGSLMGPYSAPESLMPPGPPIHYRDTRDSVSLPEFHGGAAPPVRSRFPPENLHRPSMNQSYNLPPDDYRRSEYLGMPQRGGYPSRENVGGYGVPQPLHMPHESVRFSQYPQPLHNGSSMERSGYPPSGYANPYPMTNDVRSPESNAAARPYVPSNNVQSMGASSASSTGSGTVDAGSITNLLNYLKTATSVLGPSAADQNPGVYDRNQGQSSMHHFGVSEATGMQPRVSQSRDPRRPH